MRGSEPQKIKTFRDLIVWQKAHEIVLETYKYTKLFPKDELFGLTSQMRRAAVSTTANIAEGFGRYSNKDREHFYVMAQGSMYELDSHYQIALDLGYISSKTHEAMQLSLYNFTLIMAGLLKKHREREI